MKKFFLYLVLAAVLAGTAGIVSTTPQFQTKPQQTPPRNASTTQADAPQPFPSELPRVSSRVDGVSLERVRFDGPSDNPAESIAFDIVNNTEKSILSVTLRTGNYSQTYNSYGDEAFIFPGFKSEDGKFYLKDIVKNAVTLTAVEFVDGELQGTDFDKEQYLHDRKKKAEGRAPAFLKNHKVGGVKQ